MNERTYTFERERNWRTGPWDHEPDKIVWVDDTTGLDCMILRNRLGALCGYVGVPEGHPWHGARYDDVEVDVHGGLTFAGPCEPGMREDEFAICHNPQGRPDNVWWLGFDCLHAWDAVPGMTEYGMNAGSYKDVEYVKREIAGMCAAVSEKGLSNVTGS